MSKSASQFLTIDQKIIGSYDGGDIKAELSLFTSSTRLQPFELQPAQSGRLYWRVNDRIVDYLYKSYFPKSEPTVGFEWVRQQVVYQFPKLAFVFDHTYTRMLVGPVVLEPGLSFELTIMTGNPNIKESWCPLQVFSGCSIDLIQENDWGIMDVMLPESMTTLRPEWGELVMHVLPVTFQDWQDLTRDNHCA